MALEKPRQARSNPLPTGRRQPRIYAPPDTSPRELPKGKDLPDGDGQPMDSDWVIDQTRIYLIHPLREYLAQQGESAYVSGDNFVYYDPDREPVGPDFYVVREGRQAGQTKWVAWEEDWRMPTTIIEFLSPSTEVRDRGEKFCIYRDAIRAEEYVLIDQESLQIEPYRLQNGQYVLQRPHSEGWYELHSLGLQLGHEGQWIRLRTPQGELLPSAAETALAERRRAEAEQQRAEEERQRADEERQRAEEERQRAEEERQRADEERKRAEEERQRAKEERQRAERLAEKLRELGIDPGRL